MSRPVPAVPVLLAAAAGVVDLLAVTALGGPFAGVVTGNLVQVGRALGEDFPGALVAPSTAVLGFAAGVAVWSFAWRRRPGAVVAPLAVELVVLVAVALGWVLAGAAPEYPVTLVLLGAAAFAMGAQSSTALNLGESTTYLTGALTGALTDLVTRDRRGRVSGLRQLAALLVGAGVAAVVLVHLAWLVPWLAVVLVAAAVLVHAITQRGVSGTPDTPTVRPG